MRVDEIKSIIEFGTWAPSGDNSQPWKFAIDNNKISVYLIRNKDNKILNFNHSGTYIAHGALIENLRIAATHFGYSTEININPNSKEDLVCEINLSKNSNIKEDPLFVYIKERHTNRKLYKTEVISEEKINQLVNSAQDLKNCRLIFVQDKNRIEEIANACSVTERVALETPALHKLFFSSIVWSRAEEKEKRIGLFSKTLELPGFVLFMFKIVKFWPITKILNIFGFSKKAASVNARTYRNSSAMGIIAIDSANSLNYLQVGQLMQRVWLTATKLGLSIQPVTGTVFLAQRIIANDLGELLPKHNLLILQAYEKIKSQFDVKKGIIAMQFRIGYADSPTATSIRVVPEILLNS